MELTEHAKVISPNRLQAVKEIGQGKVLDVFIWDKGHKNGAEIHTVTTTGLIVVQNQRTRKLVTVLIARPHQILRYYQFYHKEVTESVRNVAKLAFKHVQDGYNLL